MSMLVESGLRYCVRHEGVIDCDQEVCDFARMDGTAVECVSAPLLYERPDDLLWLAQWALVRGLLMLAGHVETGGEQ